MGDIGPTMRAQQEKITCGAPATRAITLFLADGRAHARARLKRDFEAHGLQVIGEASHGGETLERVLQLKPDILVMNLAMPGLNGREVAERVLHSSPGTRVVIFWAYGNVAYVLENVSAGIMAHLVRVPTRGQLIHAVQEVIAGRSVPELAQFWPRTGPTPELKPTARKSAP